MPIFFTSSTHYLTISVLIPNAVTTAENGAEAMDLLRSNSPGTFHLVLTDVCMPEVNGLQLLQYVKQEENLRSVPVIMMSSIDKGDTVYECVSSGAEEYLVKPVTRKEVQHMWQHVLRKRSALATVPQAEPTEAVTTEQEPSTGAKPTTRPVAALRTMAKGPSRSPPLSNCSSSADLLAAKQFLVLMRQVRQSEAMDIKRQLSEIESDIASVAKGLLKFNL